MKVLNTEEAAEFLSRELNTNFTKVKLRQSRMKAPPWFKDGEGRVFYKLTDLKKFITEQRKRY